MALPAINLLETLSREAKVEIFDEFVKVCKERRHENTNQIISYAIAMDMMEDIGIELGFFQCSYCGCTKRKR